MDTHGTHRPIHRRRRHREHGPGEGPVSRLHEILDHHRGGSQAMRRGDVRPAILAVLTTRPMHGYHVIQELEARSGGRWRPSAGSVYPTLQQLEDEGLVRSEELDGRRTYTLTDEGRAAAEEVPVRRHPWFDDDAGREAVDLRRLALGLVSAAMQVKRIGSSEANRQAREILIESRRRLYRLLAEDETTETSPATRPDERAG
jgi:DNA-binding PadR family transcriptional regulator